MPGTVRVAIGAVRTLAAVSAAIGLYSLLVGSFAPGQLTDSVPGINAGRTDTVGVVAIFVSAVGFSVIRLAAVGRRAGILGPVREMLRIVAVYAGVTWAYLAVNTITHDRSRVLPATHLTRYPDEQQLARICLVLAAATLFAFWALRPARPARRPPVVDPGRTGAGIAGAPRSTWWPGPGPSPRTPAPDRSTRRASPTSATPSG
jgi:hypothetical protein